jgi:hypothetical protein
MKPRWRVAIELGKKLRHPMGGALMNAHWLHPATDAATDATPPTGWSFVEKPQNLRLSVALRAMEQRPRSAVRESAQREPYRKPDLAELNNGRRRLGRDLAYGPQT